MMGRNKGIIIVALIFCITLLIKIPAYASDDMYDRLRDRMDHSWQQGMDMLEDKEQIEIKGNLTERINRSIANYLYLNLENIKAGSIFIGLVSFCIGMLLAATSRLNKAIRKFSIRILIITIPLVLIIFVFGTTKYISIFMN